jgi:hypothetical protein
MKLDKPWLVIKANWDVEIDWEEADKMAERAKSNPYSHNYALTPEIRDIIALVAVGVREYMLKSLYPDKKKKP